jgi:hypothetical protein
MSWAVPFRATPRHGARRFADRKRATPTVGGQPLEEPPAGHLDRVWPDTDPVGNPLAAACRRTSKRTQLLVMHVIFQDISTSRCGCLSTELEASRCPCLIRA